MSGKRKRAASTRTKKTFKKKRTNGKKKQALSTAVMPFGFSILPARMLVTQKYSEVKSWSITTLATNAQAYRMNSTFDPDYTGGGHQPYGRDTLITLYERYRVFKFDYEVWFAGSNDRLHVAMVCKNNSDSPTLDTATEMPHSQARALTYNGGSPQRFKGSAYLPTIGGITPDEYKSNPNYSAAVTTNPSEELQFWIGVYNPTGSTVATSMTVILTYYVEWFDPITMGPS